MSLDTGCENIVETKKQEKSTEEVSSVDPCVEKKPAAKCEESQVISGIGHCTSKSHASAVSVKSKRSCLSISKFTRQRSGEKPITEKTRAKCYDVKRGIVRDSCLAKTWQHGKYCRDECGSGIVPRRLDIRGSRRTWCKTPLSMYQATVGELGRQILCREKCVPRDVKPAPPCNVCEYILPPCREYYQKYDCLRPCEEDYAVVKDGKKVYRDRVARYWEPCFTLGQKYKLDVNDYGPHNAALGIKLRRKDADAPCW